MKYVAADQPEFSFQIQWRQRHLSEYQLAKAGRVIFDNGQYRLYCCIALVVPIAVRWQFRRKLLAEQTCDVLTSGGKAIVDKAWDQHFNNRIARPAVSACVLIGPVHIVQRGSHDDTGFQMIPVTGKVGELGQSVQCQIHPETARATPITGHHLAEIIGEVCGIDQPVIEQFRADIGDDISCMNLLAVRRAYTNRGDIFEQNFCNRSFEADLDPDFFADIGHELRDASHPADYMAPLTPIAIDLAEDMVKQNIGAARCIRTGVIADNRVKTEGGLDRSAFKPLVEQFACAQREQFNDFMLFQYRQAREPAGRPDSCQQGTRPVAGIWRNFQCQIAQYVCRRFQHVKIFRQPRGIGLRETRDLLLRGRERTADEQIFPATERQKVAFGSFDHAVAALHQFHVGDDFRLQERDRVACRAVAETGMKLFGYCCATDHAARFQYTYLHASAGEIKSADQPVVASANDQRVRWMCVHDGSA